MKRLLSIALCLVLICALLPTAAMAADITAVSISGVDHPVDGQALDADYTIPAGAAYVKDAERSGIVWYDQGTGGFTTINAYGEPSGTKLDAGAKAVSGHYYIAALYLSRSGSGNTFPNKSFSVNVTDDMTRRLWGRNGWAATSGANATYAGGVYLYYKADTLYCVGNDLWMALNNDFDGVLRAGDTPWTASDFSNASFRWQPNDFDLDVAWYKGATPLAEGEKFEAGNTYKMTLAFDATGVKRSGTFGSDGWSVVLQDGEYAQEATVYSKYSAGVSFYFPCKTAVTEMDVEGIQNPTAGEPMQTEGFFVSPQVSTLKSVQWYKTGGEDPVPVSGSFEPNTGYRLELTFSPKEGNLFALTKSTINANMGTVSSYSLTEDGDAVIGIDFSVGEVPAIILSSAEITVTAPKLDGAPVFVATADGAGYAVYADEGGSYIGGVCWLDVTADDALTDPDRVLKEQPSYMFKAGHSYELLVKLTAQEGYVFSDVVTATVNGATAEAVLIGDVLRICYDFPAMPSLESIEIVTPPDKTEYTVGESFDPTGMVVRATYTDGSSKEITNYAVPVEPLTETDEEVGVLYTEEYVTAVATQAVTVKAAGELIPVNDISLTVTVPVVGAKPDYSAEAAGPGYRIYTDQNISPYFVNGIVWFEADDLKDIVDDYPPMKATDVFQAGKYHAAMLILIAEEGYEFGQNLLAEDGPVSVSGATSAIVVDCDKNVAMVVAAFPTMEADTRTPITKASFGVEPPTAGAHPDFSFEIFSGECISISGSDAPEIQAMCKEYETMGFHNGVLWGAGSPEDPMAEDDVFEEGKKYYAILVVLAKDGYKFNNDLKGVLPEILINGLEAEVIDGEFGGEYSILYVGKEYVCGPAKPAEYWTITFDADGGEGTMEPAIVAKGEKYVLPESGFTAPEGKAFDAWDLGAPGDEIEVAEDLTVKALWKDAEPEVKLNPFQDVFETDYFYDAVIWAYYADPLVTNGYPDGTFRPTREVSRAEAVTFLWRAAGCPEPETTENPFEDVKPTHYYYKAVLWAVENGITKGTNATHFTPTQTCSTAHIITFLYRTLGIGEDGWGGEAKTWAQDAGLLKDLDIEVAPGVMCPRCDVVLFLYRALVA